MKNVEKFKRNMRFSLGIFITLFSVIIVYLAYSVITFGDKWYSTPYNPRIQNAMQTQDAGAIYDRNGVKLAWTEDGERQYSKSKDVRRCMSHVVGDVHGMSIGAETVFAKYLYGINQDVVGKVTQALSGQSGQGSDITLTVDAALSEYAYDNMGAKTGTVVLLNYKTGEILVNVSIPTFDPNTVADEEPADTSLVDRAMMGRYPPGSLMKMVTAAAAVQEGLDLTYTCSGEDVINGQRVTCSGGAHGDLTLATAFSKSCNTYFANLSVALGGSRLLTEANKFAFNTEFNFSDIVLYKSSFEVSDNEGDVAWAGIGQYHDLATPMHMAMIAGAIANDGVMMTPRLLERAQAGGYYTYQMSTAQYSRIMTADTARTLQQYMREVVRSGTGTSAAIKNANVYGKTGTAEYVDEDSGEVKNHSWFAGFIDEDEHPYAIAVIFEGAGFGSAHAAPMAAKVLAQAIK